jgi:hypothetical protein
MKPIVLLLFFRRSSRWGTCCGFFAVVVAARLRSRRMLTLCRRVESARELLTTDPSQNLMLSAH